MICDYGCGQEAQYSFKNRKHCCSKNFRSCPNMRYKGLPDYKKINEKLECEFCERSISFTNLKKHKKTCFLNPKNIRKCKNCENIVKNKNIFCSKRCAASYNNKKRKHSLETKEKIRTTIISKYKNGLITLNSKKKIKPKLLIKCEKCGIDHKNARFCSRKCFNKFKKENPYSYKKTLNSEYERYKLDCVFKFNVYNYPNEFNLLLIDNYRWYKASNRGNNLNGVSRDHIFSVYEGFKQKISPEIISHPTNCKLMKHPENNKKKTNCEINIEELKQKIIKWDKNIKMAED